MNGIVGIILLLRSGLCPKCGSQFDPRELRFDYDASDEGHYLSDGLCGYECPQKSCQFKVTDHEVQFYMKESGLASMQDLLANFEERRKNNPVKHTNWGE